MSRIILLAGAVAFAAVPSWTVAEAQVTSQSVSNCAQPFSSAGNDQVEQDQIFILGNERCAGRFTVYVTFSADAQHDDAEGSEASVEIHDIYERQGTRIVRIGPDKCGGKPGVRDSHFNTANLACHVTRSLSAGQYNELSVRYLSNATKNGRMRTWWTYEPGL